MLGQIIIDHQGVTPAMHELFGHGTARIGRDVLKSRRGAGLSSDHNRVLHCAAALQRVNDLLLSDCNIDAQHIVRTLVEYRIDGYGCLAGLPVPNNQLALAAPDRDQGIDSLYTSGERLIYRGALDNARGGPLNSPHLRRADGAFAIDRAAEGVNHAPQQLLSHRHRGHIAQGLDITPAHDALVGAHDDGADALSSEIQGHTERIVVEPEDLTDHDLAEPGHVDNALPHVHNGAHGHRLGGVLELSDLLPELLQDACQSRRILVRTVVH